MRRGVSRRVCRARRVGTRAGSSEDSGHLSIAIGDEKHTDSADIDSLSLRGWYRRNAISMIYAPASAATDPRDVISLAMRRPVPPSLYLHLPLGRRGPRGIRVFGALLTYRLPPISYTRNIANRNGRWRRPLARSRVRSCARAFAAGRNCICIRGGLSRSTCKGPRSSLAGPARGL